jgi:uncharacterized protein (TIGR03437 family)
MTSGKPAIPSEENRVRTAPIPPVTRGARKVAVSAPPNSKNLSALEGLAPTRIDAYRRWQQMTEGFNASAAPAAPMWVSMGPQSESGVRIGGTATYICSGRVTAIALVPGSQTVYIGAAGGGVWRLDPGQPSWKPLTDSQPSLSIGALAVDPSNPNTIYAGTGEQNNSGDEYLGVGVLKSTDGGDTWTLLGSSILSNHRIGAIAVSPFDSNVVILGSSVGVYRSPDGGMTWKRVLPSIAAQTTADSVVFDSSNNGVVYASIGGTQDITQNSQVGVYMSMDSGVTWASINGSGASALPVANAGRITLVLGPPSTPGLFAGVSQYESTAQSTPDNPIDAEPFIGLYEFVQGNTWKALATGGNAYCAPSDDRSQCDYNNVFAIQPTSNGKPGIMLGGGINLRMSTDGINWSNVTMPGSTDVAVHSDQHAIAFSSDGSTVYVGNDGGVWSGAISGTNINWMNLNATLTLAQFYPGLSINPMNINMSYGGTQDNNVLAFSGPLQWNSVTDDDGGATAIGSATPTSATVYATVGATDVESVIYKSTDGVNFSDVDPNTTISYTAGIDTDSLPYPNFLTIDPNNASILYFTGKTQIYQTTSGAVSIGGANPWVPMSPNPFTLDGTSDEFAHIGVAPTDSQTVYAASRDGAVYVTHNALSPSPSWAPIGAGLPVNSTSYLMTHVIPDPKTPGLLYVTYSQPSTGRVFSTQNDGQTWSDLTNNLPNVEVTDLVVDPVIPNTLYVATTMGVYWSNTGGQFWSVLGAGLPNSPVTSLVLHSAASRTLRAGTHGRGVWDLPIPTTANLMPLLTSVMPAQVSLSSNATLTLTGQNFTSGSVVLCNSAALQTAYVSATQLTAPAGSCGTTSDSLLHVAVFTPGPGGGQSPNSFVKVGPAPAIFPGGIVNGASFSGYALSPGAIATIFGADFNSSSGPAQITVPLPTYVNGTTATLSDSALAEPEPLASFYVSPGQINLQVPWDVLASGASSGNASLVVSNNEVQSLSVNEPLASFAPGIFLLPPTKAPAITFANSLTLPVTPSQAPPGYVTASAKAGDALSIYCTGLGAVSNQPAYGSVASGLASTMTTPTVLIGGQPAQLLYSGLAPGYVGLYQVNVVVPTGVPGGPAVSLVITDGVDARSNTVFIAVQ